MVRSKKPLEEISLSRMDRVDSNSSQASSEHNLVDDDSNPRRPPRKSRGQQQAAQDRGANSHPEEYHANNLVIAKKNQSNLKVKLAKFSLL